MPILTAPASGVAGMSCAKAGRGACAEGRGRKARLGCPAARRAAHVRSVSCRMRTSGYQRQSPGRSTLQKIISDVGDGVGMGVETLIAGEHTGVAGELGIAPAVT